MTYPAQQIRFCTSRDGVRIAYAGCGAGPPLVKAANWITHLEFDWESPVWRPWLSALTRHHTLIRYDSRGTGLCDWQAVEFSFEKLVEDLEAVVDAAGLERFALFGFAGGGALAVTYAVRHPERVTHLVIYGSYTCGQIVRSATPQELEETETVLKLIEMGWGKDEPAFRQFFTSQYLPDGTAEQFRSFNELMRKSATSKNAASLMRSWFSADVRTIAPRVRCPTLVLHPREGFRVPFEEGRALAGLIPGARFVPLDSRNLILLEQEPAWKQFVAEVDAFLPPAPAALADAVRLQLDGLTVRERQVLEQVARGLDNPSIATELGMSEKTVRNHVSTILSKLDVHSRAQAIVRARDAGFGR